MNNASLELGGTNWAEKDGNILGYSVGDTSGNFSPQEFTFARGSNLSATRIDRAGLIVKGRENILTYSNDFSNGAWVKSNSSVALLNGAWELTDNTTSGSHYLYWSGTTPASSVLTFSVDAKAGAENYLAMRLGGYTYAFFDLVNGTPIANASFIDLSMEVTDDGFYRCSATILTPSTNNNAVFYSSNNPSSVAYTGTGAVAITIKNAQLELGLAASPYIPTTTTTAQAGVLENTPRLNYTTGVANPYLLLEPSRTNLISQSEYFGAWYNISQGTGSAPTLSIGGDFPLGDGKYYNLQCDLNGGNTSNDRSYISKTGLNATQFTAAKSIWIKNNSASEAVLFIGINFTADKFTLAPNADWQRITIEGGVINSEFRIGLGGGASQSNTIDVSIFGAQCEAGSYATSYIPTYSVSATRAGDNCSKTNASDVIGQTEGTIYWNFKSDNTSLYKRFALSDGTTNNWIFVGMEQTGGLVRGYIRNNGSIQFTYTGSENLANTRVKIALAYKENDFALYVNGSLIGVDNSGTIPLCDRIDIGSQNATWNISASTETYQAEVYKERLTNAELATLTTI